MKHLISILIFTFCFSAMALPVEQDLTIGECNYSISSSKNLQQSVKESSECLKAHLDENTAQNNKNFQIYSDAPKALKSTYDEVKPWMASIFVLVIIVKLIIFLSSKRRDKAKKNHSTLLFKVCIFSLATMALSELEIVKELSIKGFNTLQHNYVLPLEVYNFHKEQSDTTKQLSIDANRSIISEKIVDMSKSMFDSEICSISYRTNSMSIYSLEDLEVIDANEMLTCIEEFKSDNSNKSISELNNRMLSSAAINHCSHESSGNLIDCGKQFSRGNSSSVNKLINKYSIEIAKLANEFHDVNCVTLEKNNKNNYENYCREYKNKEFSLITTDKTIEDFDTNFSTVIKSFTNEYSSILKNELETKKPSKKEGLMISAFDQAIQAISVTEVNQDYSLDIKNRVNQLQYFSPTRRSLDRGLYIKDDITDLKVIESVDDYFAYLNHQSQPFFESANDFVSDLLQQFEWITDPKLLIGSYVNGQFIVHSDVLLSIQKNDMTWFNRFTHPS